MSMFEKFIKGVRTIEDNFGMILTILVLLFSAFALALSTFFVVAMSIMYLFFEESQIDDKRITVFFYLTVGLAIIFLSSVFTLKYFFGKKE
jgi:hypothetical protein